MTYNVYGWQRGTLAENLEHVGVSRRDFLTYCGGLAAVFAVVPTLTGCTPDGDSSVGPSPGPSTPSSTPSAEEIADELGKVTKPNVVWLQLQECTGCAESALRSGENSVETALLNLLSVNYLEVLMAASGSAANRALQATDAEPHILVVNGSIPLADGGIYATIGGESAETVLRRSAENASAILAVGACAVWGSVQAARPNPTGAVGVDSIITDKPVINVAGCPPIGEVIMATIAYLLTHDALPEQDAEGRPLFAYGTSIHQSCSRRPHFGARKFVRTFDDAGARAGWCLLEMGCKGPRTYSPCPVIKWNLKESWPIGAGHPCLGCTEKNFFDTFTPFYTTILDVGGGRTGASRQGGADPGQSRVRGR